MLPQFQVFRTFDHTDLRWVVGIYTTGGQQKQDCKELFCNLTTQTGSEF